VLDIKATRGEETIREQENYEMTLQPEATQPLPGIYQEIVGLAAGQEKTFVLPLEQTAPSDEEPEEPPQATVTVHLHTVRMQEMPPLDDDLALMVGDYDSLDDLRASVRDRIETEARQKIEAEYPGEVLEAMIEDARIEYPDKAIDREAEMVLQQTERNLAASGITLDIYLRAIGKTREAYQQDLRPAAEERLRQRLVLLEIARQEGLQASPEEIEAEIDRMSNMMGDRADEMREMLESEQGRQSLADDLVLGQAQERIVQIGKGEAPPLEAAAGEEAQAQAETESEIETGAEAEAEAETESESEAGTEAETEAETESE
jgi:trigger factor